MLADLQMFFRFATVLPGYLRRPLSVGQCRKRVAEALAEREESFLRIMRRGVFDNPESPYYKLLQHYGCEYGDVQKLVNEGGIEETLEKLYRKGVHIALDEFKGQKSIIRSGLEIETSSYDFDNPLVTKHYEGSTGGSGGTSRRLTIDLDLLTHEAAYVSLYHTMFGLFERPTALWYTVPPGTAGMKNLLRRTKASAPVERWFCQTMPSLKPGKFKQWVFLNYALFLGKFMRTFLAVPESVPLSEAIKVARWLEANKKKDTPAALLTTVGSGIRVCLAAKDNGIDISGSFFRLGGEPFTPGRAQVFSDAGCQSISQYSMSETGFIALPCGNPSAIDDLHVMLDKIALIQKKIPVGGGSTTVGALFLTTLMPFCPKIMLNVESGDYATMDLKTCGCGLGEMGFNLHLHTIRSYEKLTSEGMTFYGEDLIRLIEQILPARFGGNPTDYQFVEEERAGIVKVSMYVNPLIGEIDKSELISAVLENLSTGHSSRKMMADIWRQGETLQVVRKEPLSTGVAKILPLHILRRTDSCNHTPN